MPRILLGYAAVLFAGIVLGIELMTLLGQVGLKAGESAAVDQTTPWALHLVWLIGAALFALLGYRLLHRPPWR
jgi:hypothetical protein